jgi:hypothetical protein
MSYFPFNSLEIVHIFRTLLRHDYQKTGHGENVFTFCY